MLQDGRTPEDAQSGVRIPCEGSPARIRQTAVPPPPSGQTRPPPRGARSPPRGRAPLPHARSGRDRDERRPPPQQQPPRTPGTPSHRRGGPRRSARRAVPRTLRPPHPAGKGFGAGAGRRSAGQRDHQVGLGALRASVGALVLLPAAASASFSSAHTAPAPRPSSPVRAVRLFLAPPAPQPLLESRDLLLERCDLHRPFRRSIARSCSACPQPSHSASARTASLLPRAVLLPEVGEAASPAPPARRGRLAVASRPHQVGTRAGQGVRNRAECLPAAAFPSASVARPSRGDPEVEGTGAPPQCLVPLRLADLAIEAPICLRNLLRMSMTARGSGGCSPSSVRPLPADPGTWATPAASSMMDASRRRAFTTSPTFPCCTMA